MATWMKQSARAFGLVVALVYLSMFAAPAQAQAEDRVTVSSPGNILTIELFIQNGIPHYEVKRRGEPVIAPSRLGFMLRGAGKFEHDIRIENPATRVVDETWEQPWGESRTVRNNYSELRATLAEQIKSKRRIDIVFRVFDDGVGFRFEFPDQPQLRDVIIDEQLTEFVVAKPGTAWWIPGGEWNRYEYLYNRTPIAEVGTAHTPITFRTEDGTHIALHEAALVDYSAMWLRRVEGLRFRAQLSPSSEGTTAIRRGSRTSSDPARASGGLLVRYVVGRDGDA